MDSPPGRNTLADAAPADLLQRCRRSDPLYLAGKSGPAAAFDIRRGAGNLAGLSDGCLASREVAIPEHCCGPKGHSRLKTIKNPGRTPWNGIQDPSTLGVLRLRAFHSR